MNYLEIKSELSKISAGTKIIAVSKLQPIEKIKELRAKGHLDFGENYVQELLEKQKLINDSEVRWHFIGHLQSNKAKLIVGNVELIHSVDSLKLAQRIDQEAFKKKIIQKILLQVNVAQEDSKSGFSELELMNSWPELCMLKNIQIQGLMTMPPLQNLPEQNVIYFQKLKNLLNVLNTSKKLSHNLEELSMGTSGDYNCAAHEGATMVRIGTLLFGERISQ